MFCPSRFIGFSLKLQHNYELTALYTAAVFLTIVLFSWLISNVAQSDNDSDKDDDEDDDDYGDNVLGGDDNLELLTQSAPTPLT